MIASAWTWLCQIQACYWNRRNESSLTSLQISGRCVTQQECVSSSQLENYQVAKKLMGTSRHLNHLHLQHSEAFSYFIFVWYWMCLSSFSALLLSLPWSAASSGLRWMLIESLSIFVLTSATSISQISHSSKATSTWNEYQFPKKSRFREGAKRANAGLISLLVLTTFFQFV